jgi:hypothetical protein
MKSGTNKPCCSGRSPGAWTTYYGERQNRENHTRGKWRQNVRAVHQAVRPVRLVVARRAAQARRNTVGRERGRQRAQRGGGEGAEHERGEDGEGGGLHDGCRIWADARSEVGDGVVGSEEPRTRLDELL